MRIGGQRRVRVTCLAAQDKLQGRSGTVRQVDVRQRLLAIAVSCLLLLLVSVRTSVGQSRDDRIFERFRDEVARYERDVGVVTVCFDGIGNPYVELVPGFEFATPASVALHCLFSEHGQVALDFVDDQEVQLLKLQAALTLRLRDLSDSEEADEKEATRRCESVYGAVWRDAERLLLPHQKRRLNQLVVRHFIRQFGWVHTLCNGPLHDALGVTGPQRSRLVSRARKLRDAIEAEAMKAEKRAIRELLDTLPIEKRRQVETVLNPPLRNARPAIDLLIWNLDRFAKVPSGDHGEEGPGGTSGRLKSFSQRGLSLPIAAPERGTIVMTLRPVSRRDIQVLPTNRAPMTGDFLTRMLLSPAVQEALELVDYQKESIYKRYAEAFDLIRDNFGKFSREFGGDVAIQMIAEQQEPIRRAMFEELLPHQRKRLARIIALRQIRLNGLPQVIAEGDLRELRRLTPKEVDSMRRSAARLASALGKMRIDWETRVEKELLSLLGSGQRKQLERLIGSALKTDSSWLSLTLMQLRDGARNKDGLYEAWRKRPYQ